MSDAFWQQKVEWKNNGDRGPRDRRNVLRKDGRHYTVRAEGIQPEHHFLGHAGRVFRWRWLDEPEGTVQESNDVMCQGDIPENFRDLLPDNAEWVE